MGTKSCRESRPCSTSFQVFRQGISGSKPAELCLLQRAQLAGAVGTSADSTSYAEDEHADSHSFSEVLGSSIRSTGTSQEQSPPKEEDRATGHART